MVKIRSIMLVAACMVMFGCAGQTEPAYAVCNEQAIRPVGMGIQSVQCTSWTFGATRANGNWYKPR